MTKPDGGPAFPTEDWWDETSKGYRASPGMTLRDWFAGQALAGLLPAVRDLANRRAPRTVAECAYELADAMLKERENGS